MYNSVALSEVASPYNCHHDLGTERFYYLRGNVVLTIPHPASSPRQPLVPVLCLDISYRWDHTTHARLCLAVSLGTLL
jgi:hypothetical protein